MALQKFKKFNVTGFTLIEVVLALGVFFISILALIGLLAPMLESVDEVEKLDEITSVVNTVSTFLQSSTDIAVREQDPNDATKTVIVKSKFDAVYEAVADTDEGGGEVTIFVYRYFNSSDDIRLEIGFSDSEEKFVGDSSIVNDELFKDAAGPIYRVVLTASPVTPLLPTALRTDPRDTDTGIYALTQDDVADYPEGYLAFEARVFAEEPPGPSGEFETVTNLTNLKLIEPDFTFNVAIIR